jgi:hypothetical protein
MIGAAVNGYGLKTFRRQKQEPDGHGRLAAACAHATSEVVPSHPIRIHQAPPGDSVGIATLVTFDSLFIL